MAKPYELFYWLGIPGRGEFIRLALEDAGAPYVDVTRERPDGFAEMQKLMEVLRLPDPAARANGARPDAGHIALAGTAHRPCAGGGSDAALAAPDPAHHRRFRGGGA